jgi:hypothetical protein
MRLFPDTELVNHPLTDLGLQTFAADWNSLESNPKGEA